MPGKPPAGFRPIPGQHGLYWADRAGRVWSRPRWRTKGGIIAPAGPASRQQVALDGGRRMTVRHVVGITWKASSIDRALLSDIHECIDAADSARKQGHITVAAAQLRTAVVIAEALASQWHPVL